VALVGSPRLRGNTVYAVSVATQELERRGVRCETIMLRDLPLSLDEDDPGHPADEQVRGRVEELLDKVWRADGLILATPVYFCNVSAQMKAFMDATNDRFVSERWLTPRVIGLLALGGQAGFNDTIDAMRRYLDLVAPSHPPIEVAKGHADAAGEAERSYEVREAVVRMAARMADALMDG
jgi:multimeric flavodoxin WrbA